MGGYGMAAKMRELTEQNMQEFVKEVEKRMAWCARFSRQE